MKLIVGLGNIGKEYLDTRHNAGFSFVEKMSGNEFRFDSKFEADVCKNGNMIFVKPTTFMNESGRSVRKICDFYKIGVEDLVLIHDDLDIELGEYKIQMGVGPKVHNGVSSVEESMGSKNFLRVRLGVDGRGGNRFDASGADYVLSRFSKIEQEVFDDEVEEAVDELMVALSL
jgi:peptidyl-tRNA hydrolase, PTH1 family